MMQLGKAPPFPNDLNCIKQIESKIEPNRRFPFVQLKSLVEENLRHLATLNKAPGTESDNFKFKCHICSKKFLYKSQLTYHLKGDHPEVEKPFACSVCSDSYATCKELQLHLGTEHSDRFQLVRDRNKIFAVVKNYKCPHCPKKFTCTSRLNRHIGFHTKGKPHVCDVCGSKYRKAYTLRMHKAEGKCSEVLEQKLSKPFQCNYCEVSFLTQKYLQKHIRVVHKIFAQQKKFDYTCLFCGYKATSGYNLERHSRIHTGEKLFDCKACNSAFTFKTNLYSHIRRCKEAKAIGLEPDVQQSWVINPRTETDIPDAQGRFKCSSCVQTFKRRDTRDKHEERHGDEFRCEFCPAGFKSNFALQMHNKGLHPEQYQILDCNACGKHFHKRDYLMKHKLRCAKLIANAKSNITARDSH